MLVRVLVRAQKSVLGRLAREEEALRLRLDRACLGVEDLLVALEEAQPGLAEGLDPIAGLECAVRDGGFHESVAKGQPGGVDGASRRDGEVVEIDRAEEEEAGGFQPGRDPVGKAIDP
jgi:hypothetical protein